MNSARLPINGKPGGSGIGTASAMAATYSISMLGAEGGWQVSGWLNPKLFEKRMQTWQGSAGRLRNAGLQSLRGKLS